MKAGDEEVRKHDYLRNAGTMKGIRNRNHEQAGTITRTGVRLASWAAVPKLLQISVKAAANIGELLA